MPQRPRPSLYPAIVLVLCIVGAVAVGLIGRRPDEGDVPQTDPAAGPRFDAIPFDGREALKHLTALCGLGPRPSGSEGMRKQQDLVVKHFTDLGAKVDRQAFSVRHPQTGAAVELANIVVQWRPDAKERYLVCAHYDTRPYPDQDRVNPQGRFVGANDGASGTAVLMELGRHIRGLDGKNGVDFVLFDGEELVYTERDPYFLGSTHFAQHYRTQPPGYHYRQGVLLDMVGDANLTIRQERNSYRLAKYVVGDLWGAAARLGVREFQPVLGQEIRDDHIPLNEIAGIRTCDVIDFDYPYWHTEADTPDKCSAASLEKVGKVVYEWLRASVNR